MIKQKLYSDQYGIEKYLFQIILFILMFSIIVLRRPDIIFNAVPWAEDGSIWLADIYNNGFWNSLLYPQNGYYQTISKLSYGFAMLFGLSKAALISNIIAISIRCLLLLFLLSKRLIYINLKYRIILVVYFLCMPNITEGYVNITNVHWYLSIYLMLVILADKPNNNFWKIHDFIILIISALSGPFIIFIAPCLFIKRIYERKSMLLIIKKINAFDLVMIFCVLIQLVSILLFSDLTRSSAPLGANLFLLINIISFRIFGGTFFPNDLTAFLGYFTCFNSILFLMISIILVYLFIYSGWKFKICLLFPILTICFAFAKPMLSLDKPQWPLMLIPYFSERYFFITNFAFFGFILYLIDKLQSKSNILLYFFIIIISPGIFMGLFLPSVGVTNYKEDIAKFESLKQGESMNIAIAPSGWSMTLKKK